MIKTYVIKSSIFLTSSLFVVASWAGTCPSKESIKVDPRTGKWVAPGGWYSGNKRYEDYVVNSFQYATALKYPRSDEIKFRYCNYHTKSPSTGSGGGMRLFNDTKHTVNPNRGYWEEDSRHIEYGLKDRKKRKHEAYGHRHKYGNYDYRPKEYICSSDDVTHCPIFR